ncbi:hypothetical protein [Psychrosphaera algicola]|uniref:Uncharacterized protein n=1 Tax=Psychrosphaera algicola TaxID=3023714 RepID=A0ABT5FJZ6_9GAMM|nr:hypothetical protein [Psychrosphaera sp. G1-22]MDC2891501.1 hypothetical protein [Psychrosphaera sp. G1-22]
MFNWLLEKLGASQRSSVTASQPDANDNSEQLDISDKHQELIYTFKELLNNAKDEALEHISNDYYKDHITGHNVGYDELMAVNYLESIDLKPTDDEIKNIGSYTSRLLNELKLLTKKYQSVEEDPDGFGIGTLHSILKSFSEALKKHDFDVEENFVAESLNIEGGGVKTDWHDWDKVTLMLKDQILISLKYNFPL